jgi:hypothetical protein
MLVAHFGSLSLGDHGILVLDDQTYIRGGTVVADLWREGHTPDISQPGLLGTYQFGYQVFLAALFTLGTPSILLGKLVNVMFGGITVLLVALLGGRLLGEDAKVRAAWLAALAPGLVWWSAPLLKEAAATMLMALGLLAITYIPRSRWVVVLAGVLAVLLILRGPAALALMVGAGVGVAVAGRQAFGKWLSRPFVAFSGLLLGGLIVVAAVVSRGNLANFYNQYDFVVHRMINEYNGGNPIRLPYDAVKALVSPLPWVFDRGTENWDRGLYPGVFVLMCALPLACAGAWRLRRRPEAWAFLATAATALAINAFTSGLVFRQRSMIEPIVLLLALGGVTSWRMAGRWVSATLAVVAVAAGVQSRSPVVAAAIAAVAAAVFLAAGRLPARRFRFRPDSPMVDGFRRAGEARTAAPAAAARGLPGRIFAAAHGALAPIAATRDALLDLAPRLGSSSRRHENPVGPSRFALARAAVGRLAPRLAQRPPPEAAWDASPAASARSLVERAAPRLASERVSDRGGA